jgi:membrane protein YqaA with SNARE-associated domain
VIQKLYDWTIEKAQSPASEKWLGVIAFAESSFFPLPIDLMLIPMMIADRLKSWRLATITTIMSVLGGIAGYLIGALLYEVIGQSIIEFYGYQDKFVELQQIFEEHGVLFLLIAGFTPMPFKVVTITAGVVSMNPLVFTLASIPARGARFYLLAGLIWYFGAPIKEFIEKRLALVTTGMIVLGILGFVAIKYI